ncbi:hypothetical protein B0I37DRAFT_19666 [Chaetomium sp. MPI-CAGE-AT-0009]|nr:hypothetical protein B0I37DRAFT_19666 [Chaetomium sp. MPI-CAGE-AT-0009]
MLKRSVFSGMEQPPLPPPITGSETGRDESLAHSYPSSQHHIPSLVGWTLEPNRTSESINQFQQLSMPTEWLQQVSATGPSTLDLTTATGQQYTPQLSDWHQVSSFGYVGVMSTWSRPNSRPWDPGALVTTDNRQVAVDATLPLQNAAAYTPHHAEAEIPVDFLPMHWQNDDLARHPPDQLQSTSGYTFGSDGSSGEDGTWYETEDIYVADHPRNQFTPLWLRRDSISDTSSHATSPPQSATALGFDAADASYLSDTTTTTTTTPSLPKRARPRRRTTAPSPTTASDHSSSHSPFNPSPFNPSPSNPSPSNHPPPTLPLKSQPQTPKAESQSQTTARNRNRAAASRYRAKTQAASARLEAAACAAAARHRALRARAGRLRDEVVRLKHELLARHAGCDCVLIRGYLEGAARRVCGGCDQ